MRGVRLPSVKLSKEIDMKTIVSLASLMLIMTYLFTGCTSTDNEGEGRIVLQVNNYKMSVEDLRYELKNLPFDETGFFKTEEGRRKYIDRLLEKEILLQEAQRQGLDREKDFMKSIENYWEQSLLKILLERKSKEIFGLVHVYDNEIEEYYRNSGETLPFSEVTQDIKRVIKQKKETDAMNAWIDELKEHANIKIDERLLKEFTF